MATAAVAHRDRKCHGGERLKQLRVMFAAAWILLASAPALRVCEGTTDEQGARRRTRRSCGLFAVEFCTKYFEPKSFVCARLVYCAEEAEWAIQFDSRRLTRRGGLALQGCGKAFGQRLIELVGRLES